MDNFTIRLADIRRAVFERSHLIIKPFAGGYKEGWYVEHITTKCPWWIIRLFD